MMDNLEKCGPPRAIRPIFPGLALSLMAWLASAPGTGQETRLWRDQSGQHEVHARFIGLEGSTVLLAVDSPPSANSALSPGEDPTSYEPSRLVRVPCDRLAMADQQYIATVTLPESIDAQSVTLELLEAEQRMMLPLSQLPRSWDYEVVLLRVAVGKESLDLRRLQASEANAPETARQVRTATLHAPGHFPVPVNFEGGRAQVRVTVHLRQFKEAVVLAFCPSVKIGNSNKAIEFALLPLEKEEAALERSIVLNQRKLAVAQRDLKALPVEIQRTRKTILPISVPGSHFHNAQVANRLQQLDIGLQRAQRNLRSAGKSLPLEIARRNQIEFVYKVVQRYAGKVEAEFVIQRRCGDLTQPVLAARPGGRVALGRALPVLDLEDVESAEGN
jgi:hypothetical protein